MNKKALFITLGFVAAMVITVVLVFVFIFANSKKYVCKSSQGNITLRYKGNELIGYTAKNISYNLSEQKKIAKKIGIIDYLDQFKEWFENNTDGTCK